MPKSITLAALALAILPGLAPAQEEPRLFQPQDVFELERAGDPRISPDGERVVYTRLGFDVLTDRSTSDLWIINADGTGHQPLVALDGNASQPRWSPEGDRLAFVSSKDGRSQVFVHWFDSGRTAPITRLTESPSSLTWSPDGESLAFSMFVPTDKASAASLPSAPKDADWGPAFEVVDRLTYRVDGRGGLPHGNTHLFVISSEGGTPRQLTSGDFDHSGPLSWSLTGDALCFSANRRKDWETEPQDSNIFRVDVNSGELTQLTDRYGPDDAPAVSPDGKAIAYTGFDDTHQGYRISRLYVMNADGTDPRVIAGFLDRSLSSPTWDAKGTGVFVSYDDHGATAIAWIDTTERGARSNIGPLRPVVGDAGGLSLGRPYGGSSFTVSDDGLIVYTRQATDRPADLALVRGGEHARTITHLNEDLLAHRDLGEVHEFSAPSSVDGQRIEGWYVTPPDFDPEKTYPLILEIHGGPFANYGPRFAAELQLYAAAGYVVLYANPRGSTSYGEAFGNAIHHAYPGDDYHDLMSCVDRLISRGFIDTDRMFVTGGSGGGVLSAWIVGKTDRFRAAVVQKPVINWYSFVLYADFPAFFYKYWFPGPPWEHQDHYMARSPISLVGNVTTPTMLITGEQDFRTPMPETEQYYTALKIRGVPTKMVRVPDAGHGIASKPSNLIAKVAEVLSWFEEHGTDADESQE